jgi:hypothetical protein
MIEIYTGELLLTDPEVGKEGMDRFFPPMYRLFVCYVVMEAMYLRQVQWEARQPK